MERVSTGINGLDEMLGGGYPRNRIILVRGGPGSGKTIFSIQFIVDGAKKGERGIYITLEEPLDLVKTNIASFKWNIEGLEKKGLIKMIDLSQIVYRQSISIKGDSDTKLKISDVADSIRSTVENFRAERLAVDPITSAVIHQRFPTDKRFEILELVKTLRRLKCSSLITSEFSSPSMEGEFYVEEYLADGVIILSKSLQNFKVIKTILIEKMRGVKHDDQPRKYGITDEGFVVYPTEAVTP